MDLRWQTRFVDGSMGSAGMVDWDSRFVRSLGRNLVEAFGNVNVAAYRELDEAMCLGYLREVVVALKGQRDWSGRLVG